MLRSLLVSLAITGIACAQKPATDTKPSDGKSLEVSVPSYRNTSCPHMSKESKTDVFVDSSHGRVYFCCKNCLAKAKKDPDASYAKAYPTAKKLGNKTDPIDGKPVKDGVVAVYQGHEIGLSDAGHAKAVVANGDLYVTLLSNPGLKDVHNAKDPTNDKPVADNAIVVVGNSVVHLSGHESVEAVKKDPAKAVEKAQKSAKKA